MTLTADVAPEKPPPACPLRYGLVIEWPAPRVPRVLPHGAEVSVYETDPDGTERPLPGVTRLTLHADPAGEMTADVETLLGEDLEPAGPRTVTAAEDKDGVPVVAVRRYLVAEMRVRDPQAR